MTRHANRAWSHLAGQTALPLLFACLASVSLEGQDVTTVSIHDPTYTDLERLAAFDLTGPMWSGERPFSAERVATIVRYAAEHLPDAEGLTGAVRSDLSRVIERLSRRFGRGSSPLRAGVDVQIGGGHSPGRTIPFAGFGRVDAVINPLWAYRGGRPFGDRFTAGAAGRLDARLGSHLAMGLGGWAFRGRSTGKAPGSGDGLVEAAYLRMRLGHFAFEGGRDEWQWGFGEQGGLLMSGNGRPLDLVRVSTDVPIGVPLLGPTDVNLVAADLGSGQNFPHALLFGVRLAFRPGKDVAVGLSVLNKQGGEGAPEASLGRRLRDLSVLWGLIKGDNADPFSDKLAGIGLDMRVPSLRGLEILAEAVITDFDRGRIGDVLQASSAFRVRARMPRLGASQRHDVSVEWTRTGTTVYRHHQFKTGLAVDRWLQGSPLGPEGVGATVDYTYHALRGDWTVTAAYERRGAGPWEVRYTPRRNFVRVGHAPDETRLRGVVRATRWVWNGRARVDAFVGLERVRGFANEKTAPPRTLGAALLSASWIP